MNNGEIVLSLFDEIHQDILQDYYREEDKAYFLGYCFDFEWFAKNRCPNWHKVLKLDNDTLLRYLDFNCLNHTINIACFTYHEQKMQEVLKNE